MLGKDVRRGKWLQGIKGVISEERLFGMIGDAAEGRAKGSLRSLEASLRKTSWARSHVAWDIRVTAMEQAKTSRDAK
jgi:hypothetical protein